MSEKLRIFDDLTFDEDITKIEYHTYQPRIQSFNCNDEIRIVIQHQDIYTTPSDSYIYLDGNVEFSDNTEAANFKFTNNCYLFLFDEIRYEINSIEIDKVRDPGITTTIKGLLLYKNSELNILNLVGWTPFGQQNTYN